MYTVFHITHLFFLFVLTGATFFALANPLQERKRKTIILAHSSAFLVLISGFGLLGILKMGVPGWAIVKLVSWLVLTAISAVAFRKRDATTVLGAVAAAAVFIAILMVDLKPFA